VAVPQLENIPRQKTVLKLARAKSFAFGVFVTDRNGVTIDLTGATVEIVSKLPPFDTTSNILLNSVAELEPEIGFARFALQASDLDEEEGEYPFVISLTGSDAYQGLLVSGVIQIVDNPDYDLTGDYDNDGIATALTVQLGGSTVINVEAGPALAPGMANFSLSDKEKLDHYSQPDWNIADPAAPGAILNRPLNRLVPQPAAPNHVLTSNGVSEGSFSWASPTETWGGYSDVEDPADPGFFIAPTGQFGLLSGVGAAAGAVPRANGAGGWGWEVVVAPTDLDDIPDSPTRLAMTPAERTLLTSLAGEDFTVAWTEVTGKPAFGSASLANTTDFLPAAGIDAAKVISGTLDKNRVPKVSDLNGWKHGTTVPTTADIAPGEVWLKHA